MIIAITQARMSSSRLPGKVLKPILGYPMAWHQLQRTKRAKYLDRCIMATSTDPTDDILANYFIQQKETVYRGSLNNVLTRYYECAKHYGASHIVRLTADCPMLDPLVIDKVIIHHLENNNDYTSTHNYPRGIGAEVCTFAALQKAYFEANIRAQREHVTVFLYQNPTLFKLGGLSYKEDLSSQRWTVDYKEDFDFTTQVYEALYPANPNFNMEDIISLLHKHPELTQLNAHCKQNTVLGTPLAQDKMTYLDK
jgi:spore coat polysaccharide biosynthesis protein SpsF